MKNKKFILASAVAALLSSTAGANEGNTLPDFKVNEPTSIVIDPYSFSSNDPLENNDFHASHASHASHSSHASHASHSSHASGGIKY